MKLLKDENFSNSLQRKQHLQEFWWKSSMISQVPVIPMSVSIITIWDALKPLFIMKNTHYLNMQKMHVSGISTSTIVSSLVRQFCKTAHYSRKPCSNQLGKLYSPVLISSHQWRHQRNTPRSSSGTFSKLDPVHSLIQLQPIEEWRGRKDKEKVIIFHFFGFSISLVF